MKVAIMQPYFFPYIGYWQLIHASERFVLFDDAQYMRHGWVNRNRILKPDVGWQYILVPLKKHSLKESIKNVQAHPDINWKESIIRQLAHYRTKARYFDETYEVVKGILSDINNQGIAAINAFIIQKMCTLLDMKREIVISSEINLDYTHVGDSGEWALRISEQLGASEYINPAAGRDLFNREKFSSSSIKLSFLKSQNIVYSQGSVFEPSLSIIDVLMFNGIGETKKLLEHYTIETSVQ